LVVEGWWWREKRRWEVDSEGCEEDGGGLISLRIEGHVRCDGESGVRAGR
jgi:hypothetical protein